mmetsp:Transcript_33463/g.75071  ORF Transcript_33463/g.75071 Transcript_33463/m.75071 type:complete len:225 (+) Transcript_33463:145-819(+)
MRKGSKPEGIHVVLQLSRIHSLGLALFDKQIDVVDSLRARHDFLTAHEHVVGVAVPWVVLAGHCIEGTNFHGELLQHVEVCAILVPYQLSKLALLLCADVLQVRKFRPVLILHTSLPQHGNALGVHEPEVWPDVVRHGLEGILLANDLQLVLKVLPDAFEDLHHKFIRDLQRFPVRFLNLHLEVKPCELSQVATSVAVLCTEDRANFKHPLQVSHDTHLFVQLR